MTTGTLKGAALDLARSGCPVFRLRPGTKIPFPGTRGFKDASTDVDLIRRWWTETPEANIGVPTGILFDVIDLDGIEGIESFTEWAATTPLGQKTVPEPTVLTPSGGCHIYVQPTALGNKAGVLPKVDFRSTGGYVLVPPSRTEKGRYIWC